MKNKTNNASSTTYNGYTNWETWTVVMEYFGDMGVDSLEDYDLIGKTTSDSAARAESFIISWMGALFEQNQLAEMLTPNFLNKVDWLNVAATIEINYKELKAFEAK